MDSMRREKEETKLTLLALLIVALFLPLTPPPSAADHTSDGSGVSGKAVYLHMLNYEGDPLESFPEVDYSGHFYIVQFSHPVGEDEINLIEDAGGRVHYYLPDFAYICELTPGAIKSLQGSGKVRWIGPYLPSFRYYMEIFNVEANQNRILLSTYLNGEEAPYPDSYLVDIYAFTGWTERVIEDVKWRGVVKEVYANQIRTIIPFGRLHDLAAVDGVEWIEPAPLFHVNNDVAAVIMNVSGARANLGLRGDGQIVAVCDSGLDTGVDNHSVNGDIHLDFDNRVTFFNLYGSSPDDKNGHGTHVTGSLAGNGARSNGRYAGMAPNATIIMQAAGDDSGSPYVYVSNFYNVLNQAYQAGARIHSDSWGSDDNGYYNGQSRYADSFIWTHQNMTVFIAAGNTGPSSGSVGSPATAKNVVAVGACGGYSVNNANNLASFSARGPTSDGRLKPDVVAPGTYITSCRSSKAGGSGYYWTTQGTSMATPLAAGVGTLIREYLMRHGTQNPSSALVKALMLVGANEMTGSGATNPVPNNAEGWGRVNITESVAPSSPKQILYRDVQSGLSTGENYTTQFFVFSSTTPLKVVLTWSDYPASLSSSVKLVNDLDLELISPSGRVYYGNDFTSPFNDTRDRKNNVEGVIISNPEFGTYTLKVKGYNIAQGRQKFAVAILGAVSTPIGVVSITPKYISTERGVGKVSVEDSNLTGTGSTTVRVVSTSDPTGLTLTLTETPAGSGHFEGTFVAVNGSANHALGEIRVRDGDIISARYVDAYPPGVRTAFATAIDPPIILSVTHDALISVLTPGDKVRITLRGLRGTAARAALVKGGEVFSVTLFDDGAHMDGERGDGVYSNEIAITSEMNGTYRVVGYLFRSLYLNVSAEAEKPVVVNQSLPRAPFNLKIFVDTRGGALNLTWEAEGDLIEYFLVYRSNETLGPYQVIANVSKHNRYYKDSGLENGKTYYYALKLMDGLKGLSGFSRIISATPADLTGPILTPRFPTDNALIGSITWVNISMSPDTERLRLFYTIDRDRDGLPDENETWQYVGEISADEIPYPWDTRVEAGGPGEVENLTLKISAWDHYNNSRSIAIVGLSVDNTPPSPPVVESIPTITNRTVIKIEGAVEPTGYVEAVWDEAVVGRAYASGDGRFVMWANLPGEGVYTLRFRDYDSVGNGPVYSEETWRVVVDLTPPTAMFEIPEAADSGHPIVLDGGGSTDSSPIGAGEIEEYLWVIEDINVLILEGEHVTYSFNYTGDHTVTLKVKDRAGNWNSLTKVITIMDSQPPRPEVNGSLVVPEDVLFTLSATGTWDDDPTILNTGNFTWVLYDGGERRVYGPVLRYVYYTPGIYPITLIVADRSGHSASITFNLTVKDTTPPRAVPPKKTTTMTLHPYLFDATRSTDNDPSFFTTGNVSWTFKDGEESVTLYGFTVVYRFRHPGSVMVKMLVKDAWGNWDSENFQLLVALDNRPPAVIGHTPEILEELPLKPTITLYFSEEMPWIQVDRVIRVVGAEGDVMFNITHPTEDSLTITPLTQLGIESTYQIIIPGDVSDWAGNNMGEDFTLTFKTLSYLYVKEVYPIDLGMNITGDEALNITFVRPLAERYLTPEYLAEHIRVLGPGGGEVKIKIDVVNAQKITITFVNGLKAGTRYRLVVDASFEDVDGIGMKEAYEKEFRTPAPPKKGSIFDTRIAGVPALIFIIMMVGIAVAILITAIFLYRKHLEELNVAEEVGGGLYRTKSGEEFIFELDEEDDS
ncbi:MAG: S8 family serine peptidase [Thermoplasmata archaeon]|nr:S8 family serine peptidase [Thermoplasmata archaeon]